MWVITIIIRIIIIRFKSLTIQGKFKVGCPIQCPTEIKCRNGSTIHLTVHHGLSKGNWLTVLSTTVTGVSNNNNCCSAGQRGTATIKVFFRVLRLHRPTINGPTGHQSWVISGITVHKNKSWALSNWAGSTNNTMVLLGQGITRLGSKVQQLSKVLPPCPSPSCLWAAPAQVCLSVNPQQGKVAQGVSVGPSMSHTHTGL